MGAVVLDQALFEKAKGVENTGRSSPLGATVVPGGVNFSVFSRNASGFDRENDSRPARVIPIDPAANRTYNYWHVFVPGVQPGQLYAYRVQGPSDPSNGLRFDLAKVLLDPYGRGVVVPKNYSRDAARRDGDEERGGGSPRVRLGRRHTAAPAVLMWTCAAEQGLRFRCRRMEVLSASVPIRRIFRSGSTQTIPRNRIE